MLPDQPIARFEILEAAAQQQRHERNANKGCGRCWQKLARNGVACRGILRWSHHDVRVGSQVFARTVAKRVGGDYADLPRFPVESSGSETETDGRRTGLGDACWARCGRNQEADPRPRDALRGAAAYADSEQGFAGLHSQTKLLKIRPTACTDVRLTWRVRSHGNRRS